MRVKSLHTRNFTNGSLTDLRDLRQAALRPYAIQEAVTPSSQFLRRPAFRVGLLRPRDALELPDGQTLLLTFLCEGQEATVLQLPAKPKTEAEARAQQRAVFAG